MMREFTERQDWYCAKTKKEVDRMISAAVVEALKGYVPEENIFLQEEMAGHTTFRIGGPADCFLQLDHEEQLQKMQ